MTHDWRDLAACRNTVIDGTITSPETDLFFNGALADKAQAICADCPVRAQCRALQRHVPDKRGVWGGVYTAPKRNRPDAISDMNHVRKLALYRQGMTDKEIADALRTTPTSISGWRSRMSLPVNPSKTARGRQPAQIALPPRVEEARMKLYNAGKTDQEIANAVGVETGVINKWRNRRGLPRNTGEKRSA